MEQAINSFNQNVQNLPFFDTVTGLYEDQMGERFSTKDPFYEKVPKKDPRLLKEGEQQEYDEVRRKPPPNISEAQRKLWKQIMKRAWYHDRNFCGCMPIDLGCGMISIVSIFPIIGSIIAYKMHYKMIKMCHQAGCPPALEAKMVGNIMVDFVMTLVPLLGILMSWMKASSTRNAAMFDTWLRNESLKQEKMRQTEAQRQQQLKAQTGSTGPQRPANAAQRPPQMRPTQSQQSQRQARPHAQRPQNSSPPPSQRMPQQAQRQRSASPQAASRPSAPRVSSPQGTSPYGSPPPQQRQPISRKPVQSSNASARPAGNNPYYRPRPPPSSQPPSVPQSPYTATTSSPYGKPPYMAPPPPPPPTHTPGYYNVAQPGPPASSYYPGNGSRHSSSTPEYMAPPESTARRPFRPPPAGTYYNVAYSG